MRKFILATRKFILATLLCFFSTLSVLAVVTYPTGPAIPVGQDVAITCAVPGLARVLPDNTILCAISGDYNYDTGCTFVYVRANPYWPNPKGGVSTGAVLGFGTPEANTLPKAPVYDGIITLPNLPINTVIKVRAEIKVTKPDPLGVNLPLIPVTKEVTSAGTLVPKEKIEDISEVP